MALKLRRLRQGMSIEITPTEAGAPWKVTLTGRQARRSLRFLGIGGLVTAALLASWGPLAWRAYKSIELTEQVDSLTVRQPRLEALARRLAELEGRHENIRFMFGIADQAALRPWLLGDGPAENGAGQLEVGEAATYPTAWPLTVPGFVTQQLGAEEDEGPHTGIDIAVPTDSYVRAAGGGEVVDATEDPTYGLFILIDHGDGLQSLYGHASMLLAERGQIVRRGQVIALSGSTGRSTAPHLHFEILRDGRPIDPFSLVTPP